MQSFPKKAGRCSLLQQRTITSVMNLVSLGNCLIKYCQDSKNYDSDDNISNNSNINNQTPIVAAAKTNKICKK